jgi:transcription elongation factor Elf1
MSNASNTQVVSFLCDMCGWKGHSDEIIIEGSKCDQVCPKCGISNMITIEHTQEQIDSAMAFVEAITREYNNG